MSERDTRRTATRTEADSSHTIPTTWSLAPYRPARDAWAPERTHAQAQSEQRARRVWGLGSALVALGSFASIPFAMAESAFTAGLAATIGVGFAALASMTLRAYARERGAAVALFDRGLIVSAGGAQHELLWDAIVSVRAEYTASAEGALQVVALTSIGTADGRTVSVPRAVQSPEKLAATVLDRTREGASRMIREALERGIDVKLGSITLRPAGILAGDHLWLWNARPLLRVDGPFLHVFALYDPLPPSAVLVDSVDNLHVVIELVTGGYAPAQRADERAETSEAETPPTDEGAPKA
jgi:hypothetical protein